MQATRPRDEALEENTGSGCDAALPQVGLGAAGAAGLGRRRRPRGAGALRGDLVFLRLFDKGWLVTAAGCQRHSDDRSEPYDSM